MSFKNKVQKKVLENSDSYNYYKEHYEVKYPELKKNMKELEKSMKELEKRYDEVIDSNNMLFNIIFQDYELHPKGVLKYSQDLCLELLNFVDNICKKYDLEYWLDYGNLLGYVRHGGYIPWDEDMDIGMMRKDYEKFLSVIDDEIKEHGLDDCFELRLYQSDIVMFFQMMYKPPEVGMIAGLDIFAYDYIENPAEDIEDVFRVEKNKVKKIIREGGDIEGGIKNYMETIGTSYERKDLIICGVEGPRSPFSRYGFAILETDKLFPLKEVDFYGYKTTIPNDSDYWLSAIYGDYHLIHKVVRIHTRLYNIKKQPGIEEAFEEHIAKFKQVNENF